MSNHYPFAPWGQDQNYVYFPPSTFHHKLVKEANQTIMAMFLPGSVSRDYSIIQEYLVHLYGGEKHHYRVYRCSRVRFQIVLPEYLHRESVLGRIMAWAASNNLAFYTYDHIKPWNPTPTPLRVYLRVLNYPTEFWLPSYFCLLVAGFGEVLYADGDNTRGIDRSTLRLMIRTFDPSLIPSGAILHYENEWTRCRFEVIGWDADETYLPGDFQGITSGGLVDEVNGEYEWSSAPPGRDNLLRQQMVEAHRKIIPPSPATNQHHRSYKTINFSRSITCSPSVWGKDAQQNQNSTMQTCRKQNGSSQPIRENRTTEHASNVTKRLCNLLSSPVYCFSHLKHSYPRFGFPRIICPQRISCRMILHKKQTVRLSKIPKNLSIWTTISTVLRNRPNGELSLYNPYKHSDSTDLPQTENRNFASSILCTQNHTPLCHYDSTAPLNTKLQSRPSIRSRLLIWDTNKNKQSLLGPTPTNTSHKKPIKHPSSLQTEINPHPTTENHQAMDKSDEELIKKFAGLHTAGQEEGAIVLLPTGAINLETWDLCLLIKVLSD